MTTSASSLSFSAWYQVRLHGSHEQELDFHANIFKLSLMTKHEDKIKPQSEHKPSGAMGREVAPLLAPAQAYDIKQLSQTTKLAVNLYQIKIYVIISSKEWQWSCPSTAPRAQDQGPICPTSHRHHDPYWATSCPSPTTWRSTGSRSGTACKSPVMPKWLTCLGLRWPIRGHAKLNLHCVKCDAVGIYAYELLTHCEVCM